MANRWGNSGNSDRLYFGGGSQITADGDCSHEIKRRLLLGRKAMINLHSMLKSRHDFANKGPSSQGYGFSSGHVWMWELDYKESWVQKNDAFELWCWRRLLRVSWTAKRSNHSILKKINPAYSLEGLMLKLQILWSPDGKSQLLEKDSDAGKVWRQEEKGTTEDEMARWHHQLNGHGSGWTLGIGDGQGGLACGSSWGRKESDMTEWLNWSETTY